MSKIKFSSTDKFPKEDILSYVAQLGARLTNTSSCATLSTYDVKVSAKNSKIQVFKKYNIIQQICRKLDTLNIPYEVTE